MWHQRGEQAGRAVHWVPRCFLALLRPGCSGCGSHEALLHPWAKSLATEASLSGFFLGKQSCLRPEEGGRNRRTVAWLQHHHEGHLGKGVTFTHTLLKPWESRETKHGTYSALMLMFFFPNTTISLCSSLLFLWLAPSSNEK